MNAEKLKVIAEGIGYESVVIAKDCTPHKVMKHAEGTMGTLCRRDDYNPLTDNDQMVEIMERLKISLHFDESDRWYICINGSSVAGFSDSINEGVCNAAYEYFKGDI